MTPELKNLIKPELFEALTELSKTDVIINNCLRSSQTTPDFINGLIAALVLIVSRESANEQMICQMLHANPAIQELLKSRNDQPELSKEQDTGS